MSGQMKNIKNIYNNTAMVILDVFMYAIENEIDCMNDDDIEECIIENNLDFKLKYVLYHDTIETIQSKHSAYERLGFGLIDARERLQLIKKTDSRFLIATSNEKNSLYLNNLFMIYEDYAWYFTTRKTICKI